MNTLKKHFQNFKINRQIAALKRELFCSEPHEVSYVGIRTRGGGISLTPDSNRAYPSSERATVIRTSINALIQQRDSIR